MNEKVKSSQMHPGVDFPLAGMWHQANICVCVVIGSSRIQAQLSGSIKQIYCYMKNGLQDEDISVPLQNCYNVLDPELQHCLLSPRARVYSNDEYMCCT